MAELNATKNTLWIDDEFFQVIKKTFTNLLTSFVKPLNFNIHVSSFSSVIITFVYMFLDACCLILVLVLQAVRTLSANFVSIVNLYVRGVVCFQLFNKLKLKLKQTVKMKPYPEIRFWWHKAFLLAIKLWRINLVVNDFA